MSHYPSHALFQVVDALLPVWIAEEPDPLIRNRARILVVVVLGAAVFAVATALFHWLSGNPARGIFNLACSPLALLVFWLLRDPAVRAADGARARGEIPNPGVGPDRSRMLRRALYTLLSILIVALSIGPFLSNNGYSVPVAIAVVPFLAAILGGMTVGAVWTAVSLVVLGAMAAAEYALLAAPESGENGDAIRDDALRSVVAEAARCGQIVKNVLRFSRQQPTARWVEDLVPLVRRAATLCRGYVAENGGELQIETENAGLPALVSPIEIEQVVVNLIRNAAEALEGGGIVSVSVYRRENLVEIAIDDDGRGMPGALLDRLFEPFYTTRVHEGGIGLAFAHGVIIDHGGEIHVESKPGKGTRIRIQLPVVQA